MQFTILCVGKIKEKFYRDAVAEYVKRMNRYGTVKIVEVADEKTPDKASEGMEEQIKEKEGERLKAHIRDNMYVIALELQGNQMDSVDFSKKMSGLMVQGNSNIAFIIGGSLGIHKSVLDLAKEKISFSKMTFPHQLMRVILLEQIYRGMRIMKGEPYHK